MCVSANQCPIHTFASSVSQTCQQCDSTCQNCTGSTNTSCLTCPTGSYFYKF